MLVAPARCCPQAVLLVPLAGRDEREFSPPLLLSSHPHQAPAAGTASHLTWATLRA